MPVFLMRQTLPRSEYTGWLSYLSNRQPDETEVQLAVLSTLVSNGLGGKAKVDDFIINKPPKQVITKSVNVMSEDAVRGTFFGFAKKMK